MSTTEPTTTNRTLADAPQWAWNQITERICQAMSDGYELGYAQGVRDGRQQAQDDRAWSHAAQVARNVASDRSRTWAPAGQPQRKGVAR